MADNKNMEINDEMMVKVSGGAGDGENTFKYAVGDHVTMIGREGTVTRAFVEFGENFYDVHFIANEHGPEEDVSVHEMELD